MSTTNNKKKFKEKMTHRYILHISEENSMAEKFSISLNRLNVFLVISLTIITLISSTILLISFTPLKEYIPGYDSSKTRKQAQDMVFVVDSLENVLRMNQAYIDNLSRILSGDVDSNQVQDLLSATDSGKTITGELVLEDFSPSREDSLFRSEIEIMDRYSIYDNKKSDDFVLMAPLKGQITDDYNPEEKHFAIDMAVSTGTPVLSVADGNVIFAEWTSSTGNVVIINHGNNLISVYKHLSNRNVEQGDFVEAGEVIATAGSTGELTTGPHLHYELWYNGYPVNPKDFIDFEL